MTSSFSVQRRSISPPTVPPVARFRELPAVGLGFCFRSEQWGSAEMIRDLFIAFVVLILTLILTVTATTWLNVSPRLSVQQVEASLAR